MLVLEPTKGKQQNVHPHDQQCIYIIQLVAKRAGCSLHKRQQVARLIVKHLILAVQEIINKCRVKDGTVLLI